MVSLVHGRDYVMTAKLGVTKDGKITGLEGDVTANAGAYPAIGAILPMLTQMMSVGVYDIEKVKFNTRSVITNTTTVGAYRGAGRPEATQLIERVMDVAAAKIGMDPAEIRRRNFIQPDKFPLTTNTGAAYDSGEYEKALDAVLAASGYTELRAEQARRRAANDPIALGIGVSAYVEVTAPVGLHIEFGAAEIHDDGTASVFAGTSVHGQGHHTSFAMLASEVLGIPMDKIKLVNSDTDRVPRGSGTLGSRSLQTAGSAIFLCLDRGARTAASESLHTCSRPLPKTSSPRTDRCTSPELRRSRSRGASSRSRRGIRRSCRRVSILECSATSSTSMAPTRRSRSAPTSPSSKSTPRPARSSCFATSQSTTAGGS